MSAAERLSIEEKHAALAELLDCAERGEAGATNRGGRPVAQLVPAAPGHDPEQARKAAAGLLALRDELTRLGVQPFAVKKILALRHEGHKY